MGKANRQAHRREQSRVDRIATTQHWRTRLGLFVGGAVIIGAVVIVFVLTSGSSGIRGLKTFPETNHHHVVGNVAYDHNPPAGGAHSAVWQNCGVYDKPIANVYGVHSLEHGAVWITYRPGLSYGALDQLRLIAVTHYVGTQRYVLLTPFPGLPSPIVATAWGAQLRLQRVGDPRLEQFLNRYVGGGQGGEEGGACTGGTGTPIE